jgi:hypothetical protein
MMPVVMMPMVVMVVTMARVLGERSGLRQRGGEEAAS